METRRHGDKRSTGLRTTGQQDHFKSGGVTAPEIRRQGDTGSLEPRVESCGSQLVNLSIGRSAKHREHSAESIAQSARGSGRLARGVNWSIRQVVDSEKNGVGDVVS